MQLLKIVDDAIEAAQDPLDSFRNHLGMSLIGHQCSRRSWYTFRWFTQVKHKARTLRLFKRGQDEEHKLCAWLRAAGFEVQELDPETGKQFSFRDKEAPQVGGSIDGVLRGVPGEDRGQRIGLECKTMNAAGFRQVQAKGCKVAQPIHYSQMNGYMDISQDTRTWLSKFLYLVVNKDNDEIHMEIIDWDPLRSDPDLALARQVVAAQEPPDRVSQYEDWYICKMCDHRGVCHRGEAPAVNCRTCKHGNRKANDPSMWVCARFELALNRKAQLEGCEYHSPRG
jgi:hypothetical protein